MPTCERCGTAKVRRLLNFDCPNGCPVTDAELWRRTDPWRRAMAVVRGTRGKVLFVDRVLPALRVPDNWTHYHWLVWGALFPRRIAVPDRITVPELVSLLLRKRDNWYARGDGDTIMLYRFLQEDAALLFYPPEGTSVLSSPTP